MGFWNKRIKDTKSLAKDIGIEIDPEYYKIAVDRLNDINANGQTSFLFNENGDVINNGN